MTPDKFGFVGLGQMGGPMAANIAAKGFDLAVFDQAGSADLAPPGSRPLETLAEMAEAVETVFLSVPDGPASIALVNGLTAVSGRRATTVIDLTTTGPDLSREAGRIAAENDIVYIDSPVSGGQAGARAGTVTLMWAGPRDQMVRHEDVLNAFAKNIFHVGDQAGQGQALKVLNNFLSGTAMAATSEAILFGLSQGLDMKTMLDVINVSTGQNTATRDKFPERILTGTYDAGFQTALEAKDVKLYLEGVRAAGTPDRVGTLISELWTQCDETHPGSDFTRIYDFIRDGGSDGRN